VAALSFYLIKPCKGKAAFEAVPKSQANIDMKKGMDLLEGNGYEVLDAGVMLIAKRNDLEITIFPSGKLIIKTSSKEKALMESKNIFKTLSSLYHI
jgi:hypothetical protein